MKVKALVSGIDTQVNARGFTLEEQVDSVSTGTSAILPLITAPVIRLTNASLLSVYGITAPSTVNEVTVINSTGHDITLYFGSGMSSGIQMGTVSSITLQQMGAITFVYSTGKWLASGIVGSYATLTTNNQVFSGLQQEFTYKTWFNEGIRLVDQVNTFTSVDFLQSPSQTMDTWYVMPPNLGSAGQFLRNDGTGVLSWATPTGGGGGGGSGGGGTGVHTQTVDIDFGAASDYVVTTVNAPWVSASHNIVLSVTPNTLDHDIEDCILEGITCSYGNIVNGVSFDLHVHAPNETWGRYKIKVIGV